MTYLFHPFYELLEQNSPEYKIAVSELNNKIERKEIVTAINTFIQTKLNLLINDNLITSTNNSISNNTKLLVDEHYIGKDNQNNLIIKDSAKEGSKGKPIDLDLRTHRRTVGEYLKQVSSNTTLTPEQVSAMDELVAYIKELNQLADKQDKWFHQTINDLKNDTQSYNKSLRKALLKDLNQDSTKYGFLEEGIQGWESNISKRAVDIKAQEEAKRNIQETLNTMIDSALKTMINGESYSLIRKGDVTTNQDSTKTVKVEIKENTGTTSFGKLTLTLDSQNKLTNQAGTLTGYKVEIKNEKLVITKEEIKYKYDNNGDNGGSNNENKNDVKSEQDDSKNLAGKINSLSMETGTNRVDLDNEKNKKVLEALFTDIATKALYKTIISTDDDDGTINLNDTISAFQKAYMDKNPKVATIGGKKGPDGIIGPKTLNAMKSVLGIEAGTGSGENTVNRGKVAEKNNLSGADQGDETINYKAQYEGFFEKYPNSGSHIVIREADDRDFALRIEHTKGSHEAVEMTFEVKRNSNNKIISIRAQGHEDGAGSFKQGNNIIDVVSRGQNNFFYKITSNGKEFLVGYDSSQKKWLYDVVDIGNSDNDKNNHNVKSLVINESSIEKQFREQFQDTFVGASISTIKINKETDLVESFTLIANDNSKSIFNISVTYNTNKTVQGFHIIRDSSIKSYPLLAPRTPDYHNQQHSIKYQKSDNKRHIQKL